MKEKLMDVMLSITNLIIILLVAVNVYFGGAYLLMMIFGGHGMDDIPKSEIVYEIDVNKKVKIDDRVIRINKLIYEKNGDMNIFYTTYDFKHWWHGWSSGYIGEISDDLGNIYIDGSGRSSAGAMRRCIRTKRNFSDKASKLIINYDLYNRKYRIEIPLKVGDSNE